MNRTPFRLALLLFSLALACFVLPPIARAVSPALEGDYPNQNTAEGTDALLSLTTGVDNTAMGFDALHSNTTGSDTALASWIWRVTGRLNTARYLHTATLLQNGMVLVAGGLNDPERTVFATDRRTVRPGKPYLDCHRQPEHRAFFAHGNVATKWYGPCCSG
jgi:hypothetical protein